MSVHHLQGNEFTYYLASFDKNGRERQDDPDGLMSEKATAAIRDGAVTDVFVMSHGWKGDIPAAVEQYDRWIGAMAGCEADRADIRARRPGFTPLIVGFHWPSQPWGEEEFGTGAASFAAPGGGKPASSSTVAPAIATMVDQYADRIADTPRARAAITAIIDACDERRPRRGHAAARDRRGVPRAHAKTRASSAKGPPHRKAWTANRSTPTAPSATRACRRASSHPA